MDSSIPSGSTTPHTSSGGEDKIAAVNESISATMVTVKDSIGKMFERGEQLDVILDRSADLSNASAQFDSRTRSLARKEMIKKWASYAFLALVLIGLGILFFFLSKTLFVTYVVLVLLFGGIYIYFKFYRRSSWFSRGATAFRAFS